MTPPDENARLWHTQTSDNAPTELVVCRCDECGLEMFPPTAERCRACWSSSLSEATVSGAGRLYSFTVVQRTFSQFDTPFVVGLVDIAGGLRVTARVAEAPADLTVGGALQAFAAAASSDSPAMSYEFQAAAPQPEAGSSEGGAK